MVSIKSNQDAGMGDGNFTPNSISPIGEYKIIAIVKTKANQNLLRISRSIKAAISRPASPECSIPIAMVILILNFSRHVISLTGFMVWLACSECCCFVFDFSLLRTRFIPHFGQRPGVSETTSGCIGHVYNIIFMGLR